MAFMMWISSDEIFFDEKIHFFLLKQQIARINFYDLPQKMFKNIFIFVYNVRRFHRQFESIETKKNVYIPRK